MGVRAGSREPSQQAVSAVPASIPDAEQKLDELLGIVREDERNAIVSWLVEHHTDIERLATMPKGRALWWALWHPARFVAATTLAGAGLAIYRDAHRAQGMAARSGETGTGSTEGNSPVAESDAPKPRGDHHG